MATTPVICPRCSTPFECGVDTRSCWCNDVEVKGSTRDALAQYYDGCLCRDCLEAIEADRPAVPSVRAFLASQLKRKRPTKP
jgi:hypothetical protein